MAVTLLAERIAKKELLAGLRPALLSDVVVDYLDDALLRGVKAPHVLECHCRAALEHFGDCKVRELTPRRLGDYQRVLAQELGASTVNGRLVTLHGVLQLAARNEYLAGVPEFPRALRTPEPRKRFLEPADFEAILEELAPWARDVFEFAHATGWRRTEVLWLTWEEIDWPEREIVLDASRSKNRDPRIRPICAELEPVLARRRAARVVGVPFVFHRDGRKIGLTMWRLAFVKAKAKAGRPDVRLHDCRRTAVRNLIRRGVSPAIAAKLVGWRSSAMVDRYNIVDRRDLRAAVGLPGRPDLGGSKKVPPKDPRGGEKLTSDALTSP